MTSHRAGHQATVLSSGEVLVTGGCVAERCDPPVATSEIFDPPAKTFRRAASMITPRVSHSASLLLNGSVLIAGGWTGSNATADAELYDPDMRRFIRLSAMSELPVT